MPSTITSSDNNQPAIEAENSENSTTETDDASDNSDSSDEVETQNNDSNDVESSDDTALPVPPLANTDSQTEN